MNNCTQFLSILMNILRRIDQLNDAAEDNVVVILLFAHAWNMYDSDGWWVSLSKPSCVTVKVIKVILLEGNGLCILSYTKFPREKRNQNAYSRYILDSSTYTKEIPDVKIF